MGTQTTDNSPLNMWHVGRLEGAVRHSKAGNRGTDYGRVGYNFKWRDEERIQSQDYTAANHIKEAALKNPEVEPSNRGRRQVAEGLEPWGAWCVGQTRAEGPEGGLSSSPVAGKGPVQDARHHGTPRGSKKTS